VSCWRWLRRFPDFRCPRRRLIVAPLILFSTNATKIVNSLLMLGSFFGRHVTVGFSRPCFIDSMAVTAERPGGISIGMKDVPSRVITGVVASGESVYFPIG
jgi:hypothetical protein